MDTKFTYDVARYPTNRSRIDYVHIKLELDAFYIVATRAFKDSTNPYYTLKEMFKDIDGIFLDPKL